jgi:hypothetical protein
VILIWSVSKCLLKNAKCGLGRIRTFDLAYSNREKHSVSSRLEAGWATLSSFLAASNKPDKIEELTRNALLQRPFEILKPVECKVALKVEEPIRSMHLIAKPFCGRLYQRRQHFRVESGRANAPIRDGTFIFRSTCAARAVCAGPLMDQVTSTFPCVVRAHTSFIVLGSLVCSRRSARSQVSFLSRKNKPIQEFILPNYPFDTFFEIMPRN